MRLIPPICCAFAGILLYILACLQEDVEKMSIMVLMAVFVLFIAFMLHIEGDER